MIRRALTLLLALAAALAVVGNAGAHAELEESDPASGARLTVAPTQTTAQVFDAQGRQVDRKDGKLELGDLNRRTFVLGLGALPAGEYTVRYTAVAEDGHREDGSFRFSVVTANSTGEAASAPAAAPAAPAAPASVPATLPRTAGEVAPGLIVVLAAALLAGGAVLGRLHLPTPLRQEDDANRRMGREFLSKR
jgi:methionine-rich copper-binding protein CopC